VIVKTKTGYQVKNEDGTKNLSSNDLTKEEAEKRLAQVEMFKKVKKWATKKAGAKK
jgi:hypothetical protein